LGLIPLSLSWNLPVLRPIILVYDIFLIALAVIDYFISRKLPEELTVKRSFDKRFAIGDETVVKIHIENAAPSSFYFKIKDEFPPEMLLNQPRSRICRRSANFRRFFLRFNAAETRKLQIRTHGG